MKLSVSNIQNLWEDRCACLVAGADGLDHIVDVYDMMEQPDVKPWLRENLLLITTGYAIRNDKKALLDLIHNLYEANAAALAMKTRFFDEFPKEALALANELKFPLFFINNDMGFTELVYPVMVALVEAKNNIEMSTRYQMGVYSQLELSGKLFMDLLTGKITQEEEAEYRANSLQWPTPPVRILSIWAEPGKDETTLQEKNIEKSYRLIKEYLEERKIWSAIVIKKDCCICVLKEIDDKGKLEKLCLELIQQIKFRQKYQPLMGISKCLHNYLELKENYDDVKDVYLIKGKGSISQDLFWIEEWRYEQIMLQISRMDQVQNYAKEKLRKLEEYDQASDGQLIKTLELLLRNNGSKKATAEKLFLHRNTMAYRCKQIEHLLGCDLSNPEELRELGFVYKVREYL